MSQPLTLPSVTDGSGTPTTSLSRITPIIPAGISPTTSASALTSTSSISECKSVKFRQQQKGLSDMIVPFFSSTFVSSSLNKSTITYLIGWQYRLNPADNKIAIIPEADLH
jgi:hypothetical protein